MTRAQLEAHALRWRQELSWRRKRARRASTPTAATHGDVADGDDGGGESGSGNRNHDGTRASGQPQRRRQRQPRQPRELDFTKYATRTIALKLAYRGSAFPAGFAAQPGDFAWRARDTGGRAAAAAGGGAASLHFPSVESALFYALERTRLVPPLDDVHCGADDDVGGGGGDDVDDDDVVPAVSPNRPLSRERYGDAWAAHGWRYSRGGRTDKGVSALGQVVALQVRSRQRRQPLPPPPSSPANDDGHGAREVEYDYVRMLNGVLPRSVYVYAWSPVADTFSARFSARSRTYKYFLPPQEHHHHHDHGDHHHHHRHHRGRAALDIAAMRQAARLMIGRHDFRNFCKFDADATKGNTERVMLDCDVAPACAADSGGLHVVTVRGQAFLYHQVRCMVAVLLEIGRGTERVELVERMLRRVGDARGGVIDPKPQYMWAPEHPLVLWDIDYGEQVAFASSSSVAQHNGGNGNHATPCTSAVAATSSTAISRDADLRARVLRDWYEHASQAAFDASLAARLAPLTGASEACTPTASADAAHVPVHHFFPYMMRRERYTPLERRPTVALNSRARDAKVRRAIAQQDQHHRARQQRQRRDGGDERHWPRGGNGSAET